MNPAEIKALLNLVPNTQEGGFLANAYECPIKIPGDLLPHFPATRAPRALCDSIYYFLDSSTRSLLHRVTGDMLYHFYAGDPVEMLLLYSHGAAQSSELCTFGNDLGSGQRPMKVVPGGTWLGSRLKGSGAWALMGVTMAPGFDPVDYSIAKRSEVIAQYPDREALIRALTAEES